MSEGNVVVGPVGAADWGDVSTVFGTRGDPARCWCQWFRMRNADWHGATTAGNREALHQQVTAGAGPPPGVLARVDGEAAGWCAVGPRPAYPRLAASAKAKAAGDHGPDDESRWAVLCFVVRTEFRRRGLAGPLLDAAVDLARAHGATSLEAYPVDVAAKGRVSSSELYHGSLSTFLAAGFTEVTRTAPTRPIVRLAVGREPRAEGRAVRPGR
jgi:ribosomal protein S18 acetylase RimI-like enzyme